MDLFKREMTRSYGIDSNYRDYYNETFTGKKSKRIPRQIARARLRNMLLALELEQE